MSLPSGSSALALDKIRDVAGKNGCEGVVITDLVNIRYATGFTGSNAVLLVTGALATFFTDSRYTVQAKEETSGVEIVEGRDLLKIAGEFLKENDIKRAGFEGDDLTFMKWGKLQKVSEGVELEDLKSAISDIRIIKNPEEISLLKASGEKAEEVLLSIVDEVREGGCESRIAKLFYSALVDAGIKDSFDLIVAGGPNGAKPHSTPGERKFEKGDLVVIDFGVKMEGYCSDQTITIPVGEPGRKAREAYELVRKAQDEAIKCVKPGIPLGEIDAAARRVIEDGGYGQNFGHGTGHGIGLEVHEAPTVAPGSEKTVEPGMVFTIEPGIYLPGKFGVRLEDVVHVTMGGCEKLTTLPKSFGALT